MNKPSLDTNSGLLLVVIILHLATMCWSIKVAVELSRFNEVQGLKARNLILEMRIANPGLIIPDAQSNTSSSEQGR